MLETGVIATYDAGDILTIEDIVKGLRVEVATSIGIGLGVSRNLDVLGDARMTFGYGLSANVNTTVFDFFEVGSEVGFSGMSTPSRAPPPSSSAENNSPTQTFLVRL